MRLSYDRRGDTLIFRLRNGPIHHSEEVEPGVTLLFDADAEVMGVQFERIGARVSLDELLTVAYENVATAKRASLRLP